MPNNPSRSVSAFLNFDGRCEEAVEFYKSALGAEVESLMRNKDVPPSDACATTANPEKITHCAFRVGSTLIMASDCQCAGETRFAGVSLALDVPDEADAARCFEALSPGGTVHMPLGKTFWSPSFAVVADKFGVCWMINARPAS